MFCLLSVSLSIISLSSTCSIFWLKFKGMACFHQIEYSMFRQLYPMPVCDDNWNQNWCVNGQTVVPGKLPHTETHWLAFALYIDVLYHVSITSRLKWNVWSEQGLCNKALFSLYHEGGCKWSGRWNVNTHVFEHLQVVDFFTGCGRNGEFPSATTSSHQDCCSDPSWAICWLPACLLSIPWSWLHKLEWQLWFPRRVCQRKRERSTWMLTWVCNVWEAGWSWWKFAKGDRMVWIWSTRPSCTRAPFP